MMKKNTRREFLSKTGIIATGLTLGVNSISAQSYNRIIGANEKVRVGFIGIGNRGSQLMNIFMKQPNCEVAALCDVYQPYVSRDRSKIHPRYLSNTPRQIPTMGEIFPNKIPAYSDYRLLLENKDVDAVCIATPDHWHALQTIDAIRAGKDVYVEKPLSKTIQEGRKMVNIAQSSKQVVCIGLNRRAAPIYQKLATEIPAGKIGKISFASSCHVSNMFPKGIGKMQAETPPIDFDWEMWLGPRAFRPYQYNIAPYMFRWWEDYANQISNNGVHFLDLIRWMLNEEAPIAVSANGGKFVLDDDRTIPDTMQVTYEFASGVLVSINILEGSSGSFFPYGYIELRGTKGTLYTAETDYKIIPAKPGQFQDWKELIEAEDYRLPESERGLKDSTTNLIRNFLDCVKSREIPLATLEDGHRSTTMAHLGTIALKTGERLRWDGKKERFTNNDEANKLLSYEYRHPWKI